MDNIFLYNKIASMPEHLKKQINDFIDDLKNKTEINNSHKPKFGSGKGMFIIKDDFDKPLEDFNEYLR